jgi:hypothetical protein
MTKHPGKPKLIRCLLLPVVLAFALPVHSQSRAASSSEQKPQVGKDAPQSSHASPIDPTTEASPHASPEELRQAQIEADTKKLYQLSADLRAEVAKTYKESLSITVLKKAEEVEKLAKSLKLRMSQDAAATRQQDR